MGVADARNSGRGHVHCVAAEIRHSQVAEQDAAVGARIRAHAPIAFGCQLGQFRFEPAILIEQFFRLIALQPAFQLSEVIGMLGIHQERYLVRSEGAFHRQTVNHLWSRPALG